MCREKGKLIFQVNDLSSDLRKVRVSRYSAIEEGKERK